MKFYKDDDKEHINSDSPKEATLEFVLTEIDKLPAVEGNFIGLINEREETIQFIRFEENAWLIDVPILENGAYAYSLQDDDLTTEKVKEVVRKFFSDKDWKSVCSLRKTELASLTMNNWPCMVLQISFLALSLNSSKS